MGKAVRWRFSGKRTRAERVRQRANVVLRDAGITEKTQVRYYLGMKQILPVLERSRSLVEMDSNVSEWIQQRWEAGDAIHQVSDALCAIHHYEPWTRRHIPESWKIFAIWRKLESPDRAPPLTQQIVDAWIMYCIAHCNLEFASMLALGFYGLLRTGECLQVRPKDLLIGSDNGVISLAETKSGLRNAAKETVSVQSDLALEVLRATIKQKRSLQMDRVPIWSKSAQCFRNTFAHHIKRFNLETHRFRPYSLRRGGATALFQRTGSMEAALLKGRWASTKVAKIYLADGLSFLPGLRFSAKARDMLAEWSPEQQLR